MGIILHGLGGTISWLCRRKIVTSLARCRERLTIAILGMFGQFEMFWGKFVCGMSRIAVRMKGEGRSAITDIGRVGSKYWRSTALSHCEIAIYLIKDHLVETRGERYLTKQCQNHSCFTALKLLRRPYAHENAHIRNSLSFFRPLLTHSILFLWLQPVNSLLATTMKGSS